MCYALYNYVMKKIQIGESRSLAREIEVQEHLLQELKEHITQREQALQALQRELARQRAVLREVSSDDTHSEWVSESPLVPEHERVAEEPVIVGFFHGSLQAQHKKVQALLEQQTELVERQKQIDDQFLEVQEAYVQLVQDQRQMK